ncbi:CAP domain-containing protein [Corynebacterium lubricantis]|uniref:CAP domain-containing protein n=1 Tax=Corynebacterium lubricantis TaxID=541095 RepID=UPI000368435B|nr:CAP domain-containing protein [Corynebacterium lubricantis]
MSDLAALLNRYRDMLRPAAAALSVVIALLATVFAASTSQTPSAPLDDDRNSGYVDPSFEDGQNLEQIRQDFFYAVLVLRSAEPGVGPVTMDLELQRIAQAHAEGNAVTGVEENLNQPVAMVQHHLPVESATGRSLLDAFLYSDAHTGVFLDSRHEHVGIGVAQGHGNVWITVVFSQ